VTVPHDAGLLRGSCDQLRRLTVGSVVQRLPVPQLPCSPRSWPAGPA